MLVIPRAIVCAYQEALARDEVPLEQRAHYVRWVRYFLDFCHKYNHDPAASESFLSFEAKLLEKHQADWQRQQARRAVALYHRLCIDGSIQSESQAAGTLSVSQFESSQHQMPHGSAGNTNGVGEGDQERYAPATSVNRSHQTDLEATSAGSTPSPMAPHDHSSTQGANRSWVWVFDGLKSAIAVRHYSPKTLQAWQWYFPASALTRIPGADEQRRYHLHESAVQKAIKAAVTKAQIPKRVSAHTFRHSFASHLLQANYDISTIQKLLGHSDVRTTMIYTQTVPSTTLKEAKSPLDF